MKKMAVLSLILVLTASSIEATIPSDIVAAKNERIVKNDDFKGESVRKADAILEEKDILKSMKKFQKKKEREAIADFERTSVKKVLHDRTRPSLDMSKNDLQEELYYDSLEELAAFVMEKAGDKSVRKMRKAARSILECVENHGFPNKIHEVILQKNHNSKPCIEPSEECYEAVCLELESRDYPGFSEK